jgi:hypothetical protein
MNPDLANQIQEAGDNSNGKKKIARSMRERKQKVVKL